jgi:simple sugar transport system ATP-binding protein
MGVFFDREKAARQAGEVIDEFGFSLNPKQKIRSLTVGQMQLVEIIKILYRQADLLVLDEPTSVLTEQQILKLFDTLRNLCGMGKTIIIITHKLGEVKAVSHRVTVMRRGQVVAVRDTADVDQRELSKLMVGKSIMFKFEKEPVKRGEMVLRLEDVTLQDKIKERPLLDEVDLEVHAGEVVGVAGVGGNGLKELEDVVSGIRAVSKGKMLHRGKDITHYTCLEMRKEGLAYVPADRLRRGASVGTTVLENMIVSTHHDFLTGGVIRQTAIKEYGEELLQQYSIMGDIRVPIGTLSGGNIQKVILARELTSKTDFVIFSEPTWGLDIGSSEFIYQKILELRRNGAAILLISSNLDEILGLSDTLVVMYRGRMVGKFDSESHPSKELIGEYMLGLRDDFAEDPAGG